MKQFLLSHFLYVHFLCLPLCSLGCLCHVFKGTKKTNQQQSGERKGSQPLVASLLFRNKRNTLRLYPLRGAALKGRALRNSRSLCPAGVLRQSESTPLHGFAYLSRLSVLFCAAQLREMARKNIGISTQEFISAC